jgi:methanethiol S-methyltransferase
MPPWMKVFLGFAAYAAVHSALLTGWARRGLEAAVGVRAFQGLFRLFFNVQAVVLLAVFAGWAASLPDRELFRLGAGGTALLWAVRVAALAFIVRCAFALGAGSFFGLVDLRAWREGRPPPGDGVESGTLSVEGPYRWVRHPMYAAGFIVLWAGPRWTANGLAFAVAASLYLWLGSLHEERRLLRYYGEAYRAYSARTPRFLPRLRRP